MDQAGGNNGTNVNGVGFPTGKVGRAFDFNGEDSYVQVASSANLNPAGSFSIDLAVRFNDLTPGQVLLDSRAGGRVQGIIQISGQQVLGL